MCLRAAVPGLGGDWFDVIPLPGARVGLVVGDVVGHGIGASATMGRLRTAVHTLADIDLAPDELLTHLDDIVPHSGLPQDADDADDVSAQQIPGDIGATCLYAVYDPVSRTCSLARAGHPPPILVRPDATARVVDLPAGPHTASVEDAAQAFGMSRSKGYDLVRRGGPLAACC